MSRDFNKPERAILRSVYYLAAFNLTENGEARLESAKHEMAMNFAKAALDEGKIGFELVREDPWMPMSVTHLKGAVAILSVTELEGLYDCLDNSERDVSHLKLHYEAKVKAFDELVDAINSASDPGQNGRRYVDAFDFTRKAEDIMNKYESGESE